MSDDCHSTSHDQNLTWTKTHKTKHSFCTAHKVVCMESINQQQYSLNKQQYYPHSSSLSKTPKIISTTATGCKAMQRIRRWESFDCFTTASSDRHPSLPKHASNTIHSQSTMLKRSADLIIQYYQLQLPTLYHERLRLLTGGWKHPLLAEDIPYLQKNIPKQQHQKNLVLLTQC